MNPVDYTITTSGTAIVVTDVTGHSDGLSMFEASSGQLNFTAPNRYFRINSGTTTLGNSGNIALAGATSLTINMGAGDDSLVVGPSITSTLPQMTVNGGTGNDSIQFSCPVTFIAGANLDLDLQNDDATPGTDSVAITSSNATPSVLTFSGTGAPTIRASGSVQFSKGGITTENGNIVIEANQQATSNTVGTTGIVVDNSTIQTTGTGNLTMKGRGSSGEFSDVYGVFVDNNGLVTTAQGTITINGNGGTGTLGGANSGFDNIGVYATTGGDIRAVNGPATITGVGGTTNESSVFGVALDANGVIETTGTGLLTVNGTGGTVVGGNPSLVTSAGVDVTTDGTNGGSIRSTSNAANAGGISITATGTDGGAGASQGFRLDRPAAVTTVNGNISITGTAGPCANACLGVTIRGDVKATGAGSITLDGTGAASTGAFPTHGVNVRTTGVVETVVGNISIKGTGGNGNDNAGINIAPATTPTTTGTVHTLTSGTITLNADRIRINPSSAATIAANTSGGNSGTVSIAPKTDIVGVDLGSTTDASAAKVELSDGELDRVLAGTLNIGKPTTGAISVTADITRGATTVVNLASAGNVSVISGKIDSGGGNLTATPGGSLTVPHAGVDFATGAGVSKIASGKTLSIAINGTTVDTQYDQLSVTGAGIDVTGALLAFSGSYTPVGGDSFTIVNNGSGNPVTGTFSGKPEGAIIANFLSSGLDARITYQGGDGNDVVINVLPKYTLTVATPTHGTVTSDTGGINCPGTCSAQFDSGTTVQLTGHPDTGYQLVNWTGDISSTSNPVSVVMSGNKNVTANFADNTPPVTFIDTHPADPSNSTTPTFTFHATDSSGTAVTKFTCQVDANPTVACDSGTYTTPALTQGSHTFHVFGTDASNNPDTTGASFTWTIDTTPPTVTYTALNATSSTANVPLNVTVTDNLAVSTVTVFYAINGGSFTSANCPNDTGSTYACVIPGNGQGTAVAYYVTATDTATNVRTMPGSSVPNMYTVGAASIPAGEYSNLGLGAGSSLAGNVTGDNNLDLQGIVTTGSFTLSLACGGTVTGAGTNAYVVGSVQKSFCGTTTFTFPVGTTPNGSFTSAVSGPVLPPEYSPFTAHVTSASVGASLTVFVVDGNMLGSNASNSASRYWDVTQAGTLTADISYTYLQQDVSGTESQYKVLKREGGNTTVVGTGSVDAATHTATVLGVSSFSQWGAGTPLTTTAARVSVGGRILTADGLGIKNVRISVAGNSISEPVTVLTNAFGYYTFDGLSVGETYVVTVNARHFTFSHPSRVISLTDSLTDLNFTADPQ